MAAFDGAMDAFIDKLDFEDIDNPNFQAADDAERRRTNWREY